MVTVTGNAAIARWFLTVKARGVSITRVLTDAELERLADELTALLSRAEYATFEIDLGGN